MHVLRVTFITLVLLTLGLRVEAQPTEFVAFKDTLSSNGDSFVVPVRGMASLRVQTLDTYSGTWEVQCSADGGTTYDTDDEVNLFLEGASAAAAQDVTDTVGIWKGDVAGCTHVKVIATAGFAATDTTISVNAIPTSATNGANGGTVTVTGTVTANAGTGFASDKTLGTDTFTEASSTAPGLFVRNDTPDSLVNTTNEVTAAGVNANGAVWVSSIDPCSSETKTTTAFSQTSIANIITANATKTNYICAIVLVAAAAEVVSIVEDNDSGCGSLSAALAGSTTAANGMSFAANGGFSMGNGNATIFAGSAANRYLCLGQSGSNRISGAITWVQR